MTEIRGTASFPLFGTDVHIHWSTAFFFLPLVTSSGSLPFLLGSILAGLLIILVHEFGHVAATRLFGYGVEGVVVHGLGGFCLHEDVEYRRENVVIALGGVVFQGLLMILSGFLAYLVGRMTLRAPLLEALVWSRLVLWNFGMALFNLLPIPGFDGHEVFDLEELSASLGDWKRERRARKRSRERARREERARGQAARLTASIMRAARAAGSAAPGPGLPEDRKPSDGD